MTGQYAVCECKCLTFCQQESAGPSTENQSSLQCYLFRFSDTKTGSESSMRRSHILFILQILALRDRYRYRFASSFSLNSLLGFSSGMRSEYLKYTRYILNIQNMKLKMTSQCMMRLLVSCNVVGIILWSTLVWTINKSHWKYWKFPLCLLQNVTEKFTRHCSVLNYVSPTDNFWLNCCSCCKVFSRVKKHLVYETYSFSMFVSVTAQHALVILTQ